ncbi:hypothetical protein HK098_001680 [Nowakowskiella sp. JEL0407]|nr:hypothetical protein HK098_001680 [Nowakowskiella sp. JEL0407]
MATTDITGVNPSELEQQEKLGFYKQKDIEMGASEDDNETEDDDEDEGSEEEEEGEFDINEEMKYIDKSAILPSRTRGVKIDFRKDPEFHKQDEDADDTPYGFRYGILDSGAASAFEPEKIVDESGDYAMEEDVDMDRKGGDSGDMQE